MSRPKRAPKESTDRERDAKVKPLIEYWAEALGFSRDWIISYRFVESLVEGDDDDHTVFARTQTLANYHKAVIGFDRVNIDNAIAEELEHTIIHELIHIAFDNTYSVITKYLNDYSGVGHELRDSLEGPADRLASAILALKRIDPFVTYNDKPEELV